MVNLSDLVEVKLKSQDDFLKIRETLSRIGVASKKDTKSISVESYTEKEKVNHGSIYRSNPHLHSNHFLRSL